jgi:hypothetical protein
MKGDISEMAKKSKQLDINREPEMIIETKPVVIIKPTIKNSKSIGRAKSTFTKKVTVINNNPLRFSDKEGNIIQWTGSTELTINSSHQIFGKIKNTFKENDDEITLINYLKIQKTFV